MVSSGYIAVVVLFIIYYLTILFVEKKILNDPKTIITRFLSVVLFYAGVSIIYFSLTGEPFLGESAENYNLYIFIIGFVAILLTIPDLLSEFTFFQRFLLRHQSNNKDLVEKEIKIRKKKVVS